MISRILRSTGMAAALLLIAGSGTAQIPVAPVAEGNGPQAALRMAAARVAQAPTAETWRDPEAWGGAQAITGFIQSEPREGSPASERTEVRVAFDDDAIYIGAWLYDSDASQIIVGEQRRDANLARFDAFLVALDTYHDSENGFVFATNPGGIEHDGQVIDEGRQTGGSGRQQGGAQGGYNVNWDGSWTVSTERDDQGWYAFFRVPFSTLRYGTGTEQQWGVNFGRFIGRKSETVYWAPLPRQDNIYRVSYAGDLDGLQVPAQRLITLTPYALSSAQKVPAVDESFDYPFEVGADAKIGITPALSLDLTVNTDFAQVEVDNQQVDLTRFSLFFPEKRPFFLENAGRFAVGDSRSAQMFFSRRIGIGDDGAPVPIEWGSRLSGRIEGLDVGLIHMETESSGPGQPGNRYSVARLARELPNRSGVGLMFTERGSAGGSNDRGRTFAADANVGIGEFFNFTGVFGATSNKEGGEAALTSDREAIVLSTTYRDATWQFGGFYDRVGANFDPELGFLRRSDFQEVGGTAWRFIRVPRWTWLRELRPHTSFDVSYGLESEIKETYDWHIDLHVVWESGALFSTATDLVYEGLTEPLRLTTGVDDQGERTFVDVAPGEYTGWLFTPRYSTSTQAPVVVNTTLAIGQFFSGRRVGGSTQVSFQFGGALAGEIGLEYNKIELPEAGGDFDTTLASARVGYSFTPSVFVQSLVQYSTQTEVWSGNIRFGWVDTAGTGLFLVYNERQSEKFAGVADGLLERTVSVKFSRQIDVAGIGRDRFGW